MTIGTDEIHPPATAPAEPARLNMFQRIAGVLFSPDATFADIVRKPTFLGALILFLVIGWVSSLLLVNKIDFTSSMIEQMQKQNPNMSDADAERGARMMGAFTKGLFYASPVTGTIAYLIMAGVLLLAFKIFGGEGDFKQAFATTIYAWLPMMIKSIITTIIVLARGTVDLMEFETIVRSNPGFLVDRNDQPVLYALLSSLDVFTIWTLALFSIGFAHVAKFTKAKAATIVFSIWGALTLIKVGFAAIGAAAAAKARG